MFSQAITAAFIALPLLAQSALAADCVRSYTIQAGDICDSISKVQNVSTYQLAVVNNGIINSDCSNLEAGKAICLGTAGEDCSTTYTVQKDDTCDLISAAHSINSTILNLNNPQINDACDNLYIGEVLCTSDTVQVPAAPAGVVPAATIPATATAAVTSSFVTPTTVTSSFVTPTTIGHITSTAITSSAAPTESANADDEDDDDLPYCDEL